MVLVRGRNPGLPLDWGRQGKRNLPKGEINEEIDYEEIEAQMSIEREFEEARSKGLSILYIGRVPFRVPPRLAPGIDSRLLDGVDSGLEGGGLLEKD